MKVKDIMLLAAAQLGLEEKLQAHFSGGESEGKEEAEALLRCFNVVENEVALDYLPLKREDEMYSEDGAVEYSRFTRSPVRIVRVADTSGNEAPFRLFPKYLKTQPGKIRILYTYTPEKKGEGDESDFCLQASERLFAYGVAAEYCLATGLFEESEIWDKKYRDALAAAYRARPARVIRSRRWA